MSASSGVSDVACTIWILPIWDQGLGIRWKSWKIKKFMKIREKSWFLFYFLHALSLIPVLKTLGMDFLDMLKSFPMPKTFSEKIFDALVVCE